MRIDRLDLIAFGPFSGAVLDLSGGSQGLHLIYGRNEAGKSSALRALKALLFGIPERSADNFRHPYPKLRIGATLQDGKGEILEMVRRKGRVATLRQSDDATVVEDSVLESLLGGLDEDSFSTMFGIGYEDLVRGGRAIIEGGGELGRLVFAAGSGIANLRDIQNQLQSEADALFRPAGQKPKINAALSMLRADRKALRDAQLPDRQWVEHDAALRAASAEKTAIEADLSENRRAFSRLQRIHQALPIIAERSERLAEGQVYATAVLLPEAFSQQRQELLTGRQVAESEQGRAQAAIASLAGAMDTLHVHPDVLANAEPIEALHRELGSQAKAAKDRVALETRRNVLRREALEILRGLREDLALDQVEDLRLKRHEADRIQNLGTEYQRIVTRIEAAEQACLELTTQLSELDAQLAALKTARDTDALQRVLAEAEDYGPLEKQAVGETEALAAVTQSLRLERRRMALPDGAMEDLESLALPLSETIDAFADALDTAKRRVAETAGQKQQAVSALADTRKGIEAFEREREVPTEADLVRARAQRDAGWALILGKLTGKTPAPEALAAFFADGADPLESAYEAAVSRADAISDRLRREADRVAAKARLLADQTALENTLQTVQDQFQAARTAEDDVQCKWEKLWQPTGISPKSPREMGAWVRDCRLLAVKAGEVRERKIRLNGLQREIDACRNRLGSCLQSFGDSAEPDESLRAMIRRARSRIAAEEALARQRDTLARDKAGHLQALATAQARLKNGKQELKHWQGQWQAAVAPLGLDAGATPRQAVVVMEEVSNLFDKLKEAGILQKRIDGIDRDSEQFAQKVAAMIEVAAKDLTGRAPAESAMELQRRLTGCRDALAKRETLEKQLKEEKRRHGAAAARALEIATRLQGMCREASCETVEGLAEAERRSTRKRQIESDLAAIDQRLRQLSAGSVVSAFVAEAQAVDADALAGDMIRIEERIAALEQHRSELDQTIGKQRSELARMDGSGRAAELAENIQMLLGGLETDVVAYARLKIASRVLSMAIESYRDRSQAPVLQKASRWFSRITDGAFQGVRAEYDDKGQPVIVGIRAGTDEMLAVEAMSEGTADQLFLALRIAGLELYLDKNQPIPFVVDDILIKFDNRRAAATLKVLAELSQTTQVLFFTHHRHLMDLAGGLLPSSVLFPHTLDQTA